jgi:hypothetical protein
MVVAQRRAAGIGIATAVSQSALPLPEPIPETGGIGGEIEGRIDIHNASVSTFIDLEYHRVPKRITTGGQN